MVEQVSVNFATAKKFLIAGGMRASHEAIVKMQTKLNETAVIMAQEATKAAQDDKRKTIKPEDI
jgi:histone H3/H4